MNFKQWSIVLGVLLAFSCITGLGITNSYFGEKNLSKGLGKTIESQNKTIATQQDRLETLQKQVDEDSATVSKLNFLINKVDGSQITINKIEKKVSR
jgi:septal ring factor EnvC (AmiA/AmiB activator)